ncbi:MAG: hypothetical protein KJO59_08940, partial [Ignavibacteria bacterium]|nr:hypothetical protein [Ignavibacteria bacterium]
LYIVKIAMLFILILTIQSNTTAQTRVSAGGYVGGGFIKGNSPFVSSFTASFFVETNTILFTEVTPRLSFVYARDFNSIIPNVRKPYFPFIRGISFKGITAQYFKDHIFLEEGFGLLALNDRTFSDTDSWSYGIVLSINGGFDLRGFELSGFKIGAGIEYGITFNNTLAQFSSLHFYFNYTF